MDTLKPVHVNFQSFDTDSTHTTSIGLRSSARAMRHFKTFDSDSTHIASQLSGYEYYQVLILSVQELLSVVESSTRGAPADEETGTILDSYVTKIIKYADEQLVPVYDSASHRYISDELGTIYESFVIKIIKFAQELLSPVETSDSYPFFNVIDCGTLSITTLEQGITSGAIKIEKYMDSSDSTNVVVTPYNLVPVTNASSLDNPYTPSLSVDGDLLVSNPSTTFTPPAEGVVIVLGNAPVGNTTTDKVFASSINLNYQGGSFSFKSTAPLGTGTTYQDNLGKTLTLVGFTGTITDWGESLNQSGIYYETEGIFGPPKMHKSFDVITYAGSEWLNFIGTNKLYGLPNTNTFTTVGGMAQYIAHAVGISLTWAVSDAPYHDTLGQTGLTAEEALSSLAGQVGATLRWNGNNSYIVAYPNYTAGLWQIPSVKLLRSVIYKYHLDLDLGLTGSGVLGIPVNPFFDPSTVTLPNTGAGGTEAENIQRIGSLTKKLSSDDPPFILDLPDDLQSVKVQILVPKGTSFSGAQFVTSDDSIWYDLGTNSALAISPYLRRVKVGDAYRTQIYMTQSAFPTLDAINNGNFSMNFGITRQSLQQVYEDGQEDANARLRDLLARIQANNRFIKTFSATVTLDFFGSIPVPGMSTGLTLEGRNITGIIESVSVNNDTSITVEFCQYLRVNFIDQKLNWELAGGHA